MSKQDLMPRSKVATKAVQSIMRKVTTEDDSNDILHINCLYEATADRAERRVMRAVIMQALTVDSDNPSKSLSKPTQKIKRVSANSVQKSLKHKAAISSQLEFLQDATQLPFNTSTNTPVSNDLAAKISDEQVLNEVIIALEESDPEPAFSSNLYSLAPPNNSIFSPSDFSFLSHDASSTHPIEPNEIIKKPLNEIDELVSTNVQVVSDSNSDTLEDAFFTHNKIKNSVLTTELSAIDFSELSREKK